MSTTHYKGYRILTEPYQLHETRRWAADIEIRRRGRSRPITLSERYASQQEALAHSASVARLIIDGGLPKWSVDELGGGRRHRWTAPRLALPAWSSTGTTALGRLVRQFALSWRHWSVGPQLLAGMALVVLGAIALQIRPWVGGGMLAGMALVFFSARRRT